jgi:multiple sugar transport system ATP-binding protein
MASVEIRSVHKSFGSVEILHGVTIDIDISIGDRVVNDVQPKERDIAMVFQNYALYPHMTVAQNMGFSLKLRGADKSEIDQKVNRAADILGFEAIARALSPAVVGRSAPARGHGPRHCA